MTAVRSLFIAFLLPLIGPFCIVYGQRDVSRTGSDIGQVFQSVLIEPDRILTLSDGHYLIDFGKDAFGTLILESHSRQPDTLIVNLGEKLAGDGTIDRNPGGTIRYQRVILPDLPVYEEIELQLPPDERNTSPPAISLPDSFGVVMPFRYCEIERLKVPLSDVKVRQKVYHYRFNDEAGNFTSSDTILNQVWDLCKYTMKATSFAGVYIDGDRERIPYEADAYINQLSHYSVDHEYGMAKATIMHFMDNPTWPTEWLLHTVLMVYQDYMYTGDTSLLSTYYDKLKAKTLHELAREDGLISSYSEKVTGEYMRSLGFSDTAQRIRDIVDWPPAQKDTGWKLATEEGERDGHEMLPVNTVVNCFFYENMRIMGELAGVLRKEADAAYFAQMAANTKQSINRQLLDRENGRYMDGIGSVHSSIHSNMLPLAFGIVPEAYERSVVDFVKSRGMACSVYGAQYLLEGLYRSGEAEYALDLMTSTGDRSWWNMIRVGSTITLEAWDMKYKPNSDWNHAWGAAPGNIVTRCLWGVTPARAGFGKVRVSPQLSKLSNSVITVPTIRGPVRASYQVLDNAKELYIIELPTGVDGEFIIDLSEAAPEVVLNQVAYRAENGLVPIQSGQNHILLEYKTTHDDTGTQ
jgi:hypothetical protein